MSQFCDLARQAYKVWKELSTDLGMNHSPYNANCLSMGSGSYSKTVTNVTRLQVSNADVWDFHICPDYNQNEHLWDYKRTIDSPHLVTPGKSWAKVVIIMTYFGFFFTAKCKFEVLL